MSDIQAMVGQKKAKRSVVVRVLGATKGAFEVRKKGVEKKGTIWWNEEI